MCIVSQIHQEPLDVMSTDDSDVLPGPSSSANTSTSVSTLSDNTSNSTPVTPNTLVTPPTSTMRPQVPVTELSKASTQPKSDVENVSVTKGASQVSLSSMSESNEDVKQIRGEVASLDAVSLEGELGEKREHANSAFEIMSIVEDLDSSTANVRQHQSADDSLRNISKGESGSEEDALSLSEANRAEASIPVALPENELLPSTLHSAIVDQGNTVPTNNIQLTAPLSDVTNVPPVMSSASGSSQVTLVNSQVPGAVSVANGSNVQPGPSRFKRVNKYERGRWIVKDMANTEESQKDPKNPQKSSERSLSQDGSQVGVLSPAISRKANLLEISDNLYSSSSSDLGPLSSGSGILTEANFDKDSASSYQFDRSSTAAESTLSRNTSLSSILNEHLETESVASTSGSTAGRDRDTPEILQQPYQQAVVVTSSSGSNVSVPVTTTALLREESHINSGVHGLNCACEVCIENLSKERELTLTKAAKDATELQPPMKTLSVQSAMSHLQSELNQLLQMNTSVDTRNLALTEENKRLRDENQKLKNELARLKSILAKLAQVNTADDVGSGIDASPPHGNT